LLKRDNCFARRTFSKWIFVQSREIREATRKNKSGFRIWQYQSLTGYKRICLLGLILL
jgi:hypothetical protein